MRLAVVNLKGGVGKTTTAVFVATGLASAGRTLLVDADPQASALAWSEQAGGLACPVVSLPVRDLHRRLPELGEGYDHVVIDTAPGLPGVTRSALLASEVALIPLAPALVDLDRLAPTLELLAELDGTHQLAVRLLLTRVRVRTRMAAGARVVLENLGMPILDAEIPLREAFAMAFGSRPALIGEYLSVVQELRTATRRVAA